MSNINFKTGWLKDPKDGEKFAPKTTTNQVLTGAGERLTDELANIKTDINDLSTSVSTNYETKVDASNKYIESKAYTDSEVAKKAALGADGFFTSNRDFVNGTLITTDIDYSKDRGDAWLFELKGNSYERLIPFDLKLQGYIYKTDSSYMVDCGGLSNGYFFDDIFAFCHNGVLCFWFPRMGYWQGFDVRVEVVTSQHTEGQNHVVSIADDVAPEGRTKEVNFKGTIVKSITSDNIARQSVDYANTAGAANTATSATSASYASNDDQGRNIITTYATKSEAQDYANTVKNDLLNGAGGAYDTLKELGELIDENVDAIDALEAVAASKESKEDAAAKLREAKNEVAALSQAIVAGDITANKAVNADKSAKDASGNVITSTYETKADATSKVNTINTRIDDELAQVETQLEALKPTEKKSGKVFTMKDISSFKSILGKGSTTQNFIPGNQLFDISKIQLKEAAAGGDGITEVGKNYVVVTTTEAHTGNGYTYSGFTLRELCPEMVAGETYTINATTQSTQNMIYVGTTWHFGTSKVVTEEMLNANLILYGYSYQAENKVGSCKISDIMIVEGTTVKPWEPYVGGIASPNMNFPQKIEHAGKNVGNLFNLFTADNVKGVIHPTGTVDYPPHVGLSANSVFTKDTLIGFETDKQVTVQAKFFSTRAIDISATNVGIGIMYEDGTTSIGNRVTPNSIGVISKVTSDVAKKVIGIGFVYDSVGGNEYNAGFVSVMINEGPVAKAYEPYKYENNLSINQRVNNKNIWDKVFAADINNWGTDGRESNQYYKCIPIYVGAGNTATFSYPEIPTGISGIYACVTKELLYGDNSKTWFYHQTNNNLCINNFTITAVEDYLYLWCNKDGIKNGNFAQYIGNNLQVELSETKTDYIEHEHQDIKLSPPKPFTKWDSVIEKDGWLYWNYKSKKLTFDGTENWLLGYGSGDGINNRFEVHTVADFDTSGSNNSVIPKNVYCNMFIYEFTGGIPSKPDRFRVRSESAGSGNAYILFNINTDIVPLDDIDAWKAKLQELFAAGTPLYIEYETIDSEQVPFTEEEMAQYRALVGYEGITTIQSDVEVEVAGLKDSDTWDYIHDTFAEKADRSSFTANYGATTFSDIKEAIDLGKTICLDTGISRFLNLAPGTYDKNGKLVQSWDVLTTAWKDFYTAMTGNTVNLSGHELFLEAIAKNANTPVYNFIPPHGISNVISNEATTLVIHPDITHITTYAFFKYGNGQNIDTYVIPNTVEIIEQTAFHNYSATYIIMNPACTVATDIYTNSGFTSTLYYQGILQSTPISGVTVIADFSPNNIALTEHNNSRICFHKIEGTNIVNYFCTPTNDWFIEQINTGTKFHAVYGQTSYERLNNALINNSKVAEVRRDKIVNLQPGTYDADGNLIHTWEELLTASGLTEDAVANTDGTIIPPSNIFLRAGYTTFPSKVVIPEHITAIGSYVFWFYTISEEMLPTVREIYILGENTAIYPNTFHNATAIYVPWDSSVATVTGGTNIYYNVDMSTACTSTHTYYTHAYSKVGADIVFSCLEDSEHVEYICSPSGWSIKKVPTMKLGDALLTYDTVNQQIVISFE